MFLLAGMFASAQLLHRYDFETAGNASDRVGTAHGTLRGTATVSGGALNTTGAAGGLSGGVPQNCVSLPASAVAGITNAFSVEVWFSCSPNGGWNTLYSFSANNTANYVLATPAADYLPNPSRIAVKGGGGNAAELLANQTPTTNGIVHNMAVTYDGTNVTYYLDGALPTFSGLQNSFADPGLNLSSMTYIGIAGGAPFGDPTIKGKVYDFRIYGQALTAAQVAVLYSLGTNASNAAISNAIAFTVAAQPKSMIVPQGGIGTGAISVARRSGFTNEVSLSAENLPAGVTASFNPQPAVSNSVMTLTAGSSVAVGHYEFSVVGAVGGVSNATPMLLMVTSNSAVAFTWPSYSPNLNYNFTNEFAAIPMPTNVLDDCSGVTTTVTLSNNWFCFRFGSCATNIVTSNAWVPMLQTLNSNFVYFRDVMGWPPDKRAKRGYKSAIYLLGSCDCVGGQPSDLGGWQGSINYNGEDWPMGLFSYYPVYSWDPACPYSDKLGQQGACTHEMIHSVLADMPGCKQAAWFQEGGNTWLQGEAEAQKTGNYSGIGWLSAGSMLAPFMPIECYSGWLQDDSFGGPSAEGVNMFSNSVQICTWRNMLGGVQYSEAFPHFMGEMVSPGSVAWIWRYCTNRVVEGLATAPGGLGDGQTRRLIMEYRARGALCDYGKWSGAYTALLDNNWGAVWGAEWSPYWINCAPWTARCYVVTTNVGGTLQPEWRTLPGWSGANQIPLQVGGVFGTTASVTFTPLGNNMTCQLVYRAADNSVVYGQPVSGGACSVKFDKAPKNNVVIAVICNTDWQYLGEATRQAKFDYRLTLGTNVTGTANIATKWYSTATTTKGVPVWDGGATGSGTDLDTAANWNGDAVPGVSGGETAQFGGLVPGNLLLTHGGTAYAGLTGNPGINLELTSQQTGAVTVDSGVNTSALRMNNLTIADSAGAFTLGNGANTFNLTLGGTAGQTHAWQNNSTNPATLNSDVTWGLGGGGAHTLVLSGPGDWMFNNAVNNGTGGSGPVLSLTKNGAGKLTLNGAVSPTGAILLNAGTVLVNGAFTWSTLGLGYGLTLGGNGTINGGLVLSSNVTLSPGAGIGRLTIGNNAVLQAGSTTLMEISKSSLTNDQLRVTGALTLGGRLTVTNLSGTLAGGDAFQLFQANGIASSFATFSLPPLGANLAWNTNKLGGSGVLAVYSTVATNLTAMAANGTLQLSWPADHAGWMLQVQTNNLGAGLGTNWVSVPGTDTNTQFVVPLVPENASVFYRLIYQ